MKEDEHLDHLVDMLLKEAIGGEYPPDLRDRILHATINSPVATPTTRRPSQISRSIPKRSMNSRKKMPLMAIAAVVALILCVAVLLGSRWIARERTPVVIAQSGTVHFPQSGLTNGSRLATHEASYVTLAWPDGAQMDVKPNTEIRFSQIKFWDRAKTLSLVTGSISAKVPPQPKDSPMRISTTHGNVTVVGTEFTLLSKPHLTRLEVAVGQVRFEPTQGKAIVVNAGSFTEAKTESAQNSETSTPQPNCVVRGFTLIDADTDLAIRELADGETVSLSALPSPRISIRSDFDGEAPVAMLLNVTRPDKKNTGIKTYEYSSLPPQSHAPYFVTGDYSSLGRSADAQPWTPKAGKHRVTATPLVMVDGKQQRGETLTIHIEFIP